MNNQKRVYTWRVLWSLIVFWLANLGHVIAGEIKVVYVAPTPQLAAFGDTSFTSAEIPGGYRAVNVDASTVDAILRIAPQHVGKLIEGLQPESVLRREVARLMTISDQVDVTFYLVDDRTGLRPDAVGVFTAYHVGEKVAAWPAAILLPTVDGELGKQIGIVGLGETAGQEIVSQNPGGERAWEATVLHETFHTQMLGEPTKWQFMQTAYGGDGDHYQSELLGDEAVAVDEGFGSFYGGQYDTAEIAELNNFLSETKPRYLLESRSVHAPLAAKISTDQRDEVTVSLADGTQAKAWLYRWQDVPGRYLLYCESTTTAFMHFFWLHANADRARALAMIDNMAKAMAPDRKQRRLTVACTHLALQLEDLAAVGSSSTSGLYPYALLDLLTHFDMDAQEFQAELDRDYPERHPRARRQYWQHRARIRQLAEPFLSQKPIAFHQAVAAVHAYCAAPGRSLTSSDSIPARRSPQSGNRLEGLPTHLSPKLIATHHVDVPVESIRGLVQATTGWSNEKLNQLATTSTTVTMCAELLQVAIPQDHQSPEWQKSVELYLNKKMAGKLHFGGGLGNAAFVDDIERITATKFPASFAVQDPASHPLIVFFVLPERARQKLVNSDLTSLFVLDEFRFGAATLTPAHRPILNGIAKRTIASFNDPLDRHVTHILISGHTDRRGSAPFNDQLGLKRAKNVSDAVKKSLYATAPLALRPKLRDIEFKVESAGEEFPLSDKERNDAGERRVEVQLIIREVDVKGQSPFLPLDRVTRRGIRLLLAQPRSERQQRLMCARCLDDPGAPPRPLRFEIAARHRRYLGVQA